jgi:uncharacterized protein (TIGR00725 family)
MRIAVCGSGQAADESIAARARKIGKEIAEQGHILLTGGCNGYPYEAAKAAFSNKGKVIGFSPAKDEKEHIEKYDFPADNFSEIIFTGKGIPGRNFDLISNSDAVIIIGGKVGTLNEFTLAYHFGKIIGVLAGSGEIAELLPEIAGKIEKRSENEKLIYEKEPEKLVKGVIECQKRKAYK